MREGVFVLAGRRSPGYRLGEFLLEPDEHRLTCKGEEIPLRPKSFELLGLLVERHGHLVTKEDLLTAVWPDSYVTEGTLRQIVWEIREALGDRGEPQRLIKTIPKVGYQFVGEVRETQSTISPRAKIWRALFAVTASILLLIFVWQWRSLLHPESRAPSIAVLPIDALPPSSQTPSASLLPVPLTSSLGHETYPSLSPDGKIVAFVEGVEEGSILVKQVGIEEAQALQITSGRDKSPVWSPDGQSITFLRHLGKRIHAVISIPSLGGPERELVKVQLTSWPVPPLLSWSTSGGHLVIAGYPASEKGAGLFLYSMESRQMSRLTSVPQGFWRDDSPAFSPDGHTLAFVRTKGQYRGDVYTLDLDQEMQPQGEPTRLTQRTEMMRGLTWKADGNEIIYASGRFPDFRLWRVSASEPGSPVALAFAGSGIRRPNLSREGDRFVYERFFVESNFWQLNIDATGARIGPPEMFPSSSRYEGGCDYSPDGKRVVFSSLRSGNSELYVSDRDGSNPVRLTSSGEIAMGEPRWSPDGDWIAFVARPEGQGDIWVVEAAGGGLPKKLTDDPVNDTLPSWSADGEWIYFSSPNRGGQGIWKIPLAGREVLESEGRELGRSADGEWTYYSAEGVLWKHASLTGERVPLSEELDGYYHHLINNRIYYVRGEIYLSGFSIVFYDLHTGAISEIARMEKRFAWGFTVAPDERSILFSQVDQAGSDLMLVENFR